MPFVIGGLMAASAIAGGIGSAGQNKAQAIQAQMQQDQQNFLGKMQNEAQNRNILRQWEAQYHANKALERGALTQAVAQSFYGRENYKNQTTLLSRETSKTNAAFLSKASASGISVNSASARAMLRNSMSDAAAQSRAMRIGYENQNRDIETNYRNILGQRNLNAPELQNFVAGKAIVADSSSSIMTTAMVTGLINGVSGGIGAYNQAGGNMSNTFSGKLLHL
jgi:hypothetical protein